jgi:uncharacterized membrane protein (UPF0127 family)
MRKFLEPSLEAIACAGLLLMLAAGCDQPKSAAPPSAAPPAPLQTTPEGHLNQAQPKLRTMKLFLGNQELITELCTNNVQRMTGMMFRTNLAENEAMLFVFPYEHRTSFYMKNTVVPLSAAYIDPKGVILEIHDLQPKDLRGAEANADNIQYVLETTQGWFKRHHLGTGVVIRTERGTLGKTFFSGQ